MTVIKPRSRVNSCVFKIHVWFLTFIGVYCLQYFSTYDGFYCTAKCVSHNAYAYPLLDFLPA